MNRPSSASKALLSLALGGLLPALLFGRDEKIIPEAYPPERYELIWKRSPFTLSSTNQEPSAGFAANLALAGLLKIDGEYFAAVIDKVTQKRGLISSTPNREGLTLRHVEYSEDLPKVVVVIQKGGETSTLHYDLAFIQSVIVQGNPQPEAVETRESAASDPRAMSPPPANLPPKHRTIPSVPTKISTPAGTEGDSPSSSQK